MLAGVGVLTPFLIGCAAESSISAAPASAPVRAPATTVPHLTEPNSSDSLLFVARAHTGSITMSAPTTATITLTAAPTMTWFSDRPQHDAGVTSSRDALEAFGWADNGDDLGVPPNAVLLAEEFGDDSPVVEIMTANISGDDLSFDVTFEAPPNPSVTGPLTHVEMFIDSTPPTFAQRNVGGTLVWFNGRDAGVIIPDDPSLPEASLARGAVREWVKAGDHVVFTLVIEVTEDVLAYDVRPG